MKVGYVVIAGLNKLIDQRSAWSWTNIYAILSWNLGGTSYTTKRPTNNFYFQFGNFLPQGPCLLDT